MREDVRKGGPLCLPICVGVFAHAGVFGVLAAIPLSVMLAFTVHSMRDSGIEGICGIVVTILVMRRSGGPPAAMVSGAASVALLRSFIG